MSAILQQLSRPLCGFQGVQRSFQPRRSPPHIQHLESSSLRWHGCAQHVSGLRRRSAVQAANDREGTEESSKNRELLKDTSREVPSTSSNPGQAPAGSEGSPDLSPEEQDALIRRLFDEAKKDVINTLGLSPTASNYLKSMTYEEVMEPEGFMNKVAEDVLGPLISIIGVEQSAFSFLLEVIQIGLLLQLISSGTLFYATENILHYDTGAAFRCACALQLGYLMRPLLSVERLLWPIYEDLLRLFLDDPEASYGAQPATSREMQQTVNSLGLLVGAAFLLPQFLWGWSPRESLQFVVPLGMGWFMCDVWLMLALVIKLQMR